MYAGARVTDAVDYLSRRDELRGAVKVVRKREPERFRWRHAVRALNATASSLQGLARMRVEEPIRETVLDLPDVDLKREVVLDARRFGVDLDRGEILPFRTVGDLRRFSFLTGTDLEKVHRFIDIPDDFFAPVETAGVVLVGRAYAEAYIKRARKLWLRIPDPDHGAPHRLHHKLMAERAQREARLADRWRAFAKAVSESATAQLPPEFHHPVTAA